MNEPLFQSFYFSPMNLQTGIQPFFNVFFTLLLINLTHLPSAKCQACGAGTYGNGCRPCQLEYARHGTDLNATHCQRCKLGETTTTTGAATCEKCDVGKFGSTNGVCSICPGGRYQDGKGEIVCKDCSVDTYLVESGKSSNADCIGCSTGRSTGTKTRVTSSKLCLCKRSDFYQKGK